MSSTNPRRGFAILVPLALAIPLAPACSSGGGGSGAVGNVVIKDANNYTSVSTLTIPTLQTAPMADLTFTWDAITKDLLCHPSGSSVPTGSIDNVAFLQIKGMAP